MTERRSIYLAGTSHGEAALETQMRYAGINDYECQYKWHPTRRFRFDFAFPAHKLAVEVDGGSWVKGQRAHGKGDYDRIRDAEAVCLGWRVLRVTPAMVTNGKALEYIECLLRGDQDGTN